MNDLIKLMDIISFLTLTGLKSAFITSAEQENKLRQANRLILEVKESLL
jgi:hypothetical protein